MDDALAFLLARADLPSPGADIINPDEVLRWPPGRLELLVRAGLLAPAPPATRITCPACFEDHTADVLWVPAPSGEGSRPYLICPGYGRVPLEHAQLKRWRIDLASLATALASLLNDVTRTEGIISERLWHLGTAEVGSSLHDLFLLRGGTWGDPVAHDLNGNLSTYLAPVVLSLTDVPADLPTVAQFVPLPRVLSLAEGHLVIDRHYLDALIQPPDPDTAPYLFRQDGEIWTVVFEGRKNRFKNRVGLHYLQEMLRHPGQFIAAATLFAAVHGQSLAPPTEDDDEESERTEVASLGIQGDLGELMDDEGLKAYRQRVEELRVAIRDARENYDHEGATALQEELSSILDELLSAEGQEGKPRRVGEPTGNVRSAVTQALSAVRKVIADEDPDLGEHLRLFLTTGKEILYAPDHPTPWVF